MTQILEQNFHEILSVSCKMKEVIIILTRQVLILRACGERWLQKRKESCKRERRSNTESKHRWHVKGENYGKAIPTVFHSFHSPESQKYYPA